MSTSGVRQRGGQTPKRQTTPAPTSKGDEILDNIKETVTSEWDYKAALGVFTILSFITRFWGISHPNEVVFDEVHFGKVCLLEPNSRSKVVAWRRRLALPIILCTNGSII